MLLDSENDQSLYLFLPYSDIRNDKAWVGDASLYSQIHDPIRIERLKGIHQLGLLSSLGSDVLIDPKLDFYHVGFHHDRYDHSLVVARVMEFILKQNNMPKEMMNLGILTGLLHDIATPALGDSTMAVDPKNLNEEDHWQTMIPKKGWRWFEQLGVTQDQLDKAIHNHGAVGQVLDVADRITYVAKDAMAVVGNVRKGETAKYPRGYLRKVHQTVSDNPEWANVYQDITIDKNTEQVYFEDDYHLKTFLKLRMLLTVHLYTDPVNQIRDAMTAKLVKPLYSPDQADKKPLTPTKLREMSDRQLVDFLGKQYQLPYFAEFTIWNFARMNPQFEKFDQLETALARNRDLEHNDKTASFGVRSITKFKSGGDYLVKMPVSGELKPFRDVDPKFVSGIEDYAKKSFGHYVLYGKFTDKTPETPTLREALKSANL